MPQWSWPTNWLVRWLVASPGPTSRACARAVVDELIRQGVREAVLAPGSRSAPLAFALVDADHAGRLRLHVRIDERTAAFLALGLAKASGRPVPVVTTSGTAAANLHPAALEAWHSHVPLVAVTADRPRTMAHTGANQTTTQDQLFAPHVRAAAQLDDVAGDESAWRFEVSRLIAAATGARTRLPGPVHVDVALSEPLVPGPAKLDNSEGPLAAPASPVVAPSRPGEPHVLDADRRTVVVAGDAGPAAGAAAVDFARTAGAPLLAEPSSNARRDPALSTYRVLLGSALGERIERVVMFGHPTLSRPVTRLLGRPDVELIVVSPYADWPDPGRRAAAVVDSVVARTAADPAWPAAWLAAEQRVRRELDRRLTGEDSGLSGPAVAAAVWAALGADHVLVAGSSNAVRDLDLAPVRPTAPVVYANRGLSGIDGTVSTAMGLALATARPTTALLGDLTLLHDSTGLVVGPDEPRPDLRIVVANDDGGSIFATLEQGASDYAATFERIFGTPHGTDIAALAAATHTGYRRAESVDELRAVLAQPPRGIELVEVPLDRTRRRELDAAIRRLAELV